MKIIDAHHHLWDLDTNKYTWLEKAKDHPSGDMSIIARNYLVEDFINDAKDHELIKSVHVQAEMDHSVHPSVETNWLQGIADHPDSKGFPNAIIAYADLSDDDVESVLVEHCKSPNMRGVRQILNYSNENPNFNMVDRGDLMPNNKWRDGLSLFEKYNLSFDLQIWPWQLTESHDVVSNFPNILFIINHTGMPLVDDMKHIKTWSEGMKKLASFDNVVVKLSGLNMSSDDLDGIIKEAILETIDTFGVDRSMFASNFPVDKKGIEFTKLWNFFDRITSHFSEGERNKLFVENSEKYYRI